ncbi:MAG: shikimate dehydrogenase [Casimicrobiaceae bacterium]|nr:shikimate dehydrogenase [Casimicrobiaceae bacterium]MDW8311651.1 shikimate dehydrogenase [Burkholderiales bacterium]
MLGLIGRGIGASLTPALHEEEGRRQGLIVHYQLVDFDRSGAGDEALKSLVLLLGTIGFAGVNVTYPFKQAVIALLDRLSPEAEAIGAVNTVVVERGGLVGHNTDASGWRYGLEHGLPGADLSRVVLVGAGGAGAAVAYALGTLGAESVVILDRAPERAEELARRAARTHPKTHYSTAPISKLAFSAATGVVQATPVGMHKLPGMPFDPEWLPERAWVNDIVYFPIETALLAAARARALRVLDGGAMAVGQAAAAFEHFTGRPANVERMRQHFMQLLRERKEPDAAQAQTGTPG